MIYRQKVEEEAKGGEGWEGGRIRCKNVEGGLEELLRLGTLINKLKSRGVILKTGI